MASGDCTQIESDSHAARHEARKSGAGDRTQIVEREQPRSVSRGRVEIPDTGRRKAGSEKPSRRSAGHGLVVSSSSAVVLSSYGGCSGLLPHPQAGAGTLRAAQSPASAAGEHRPVSAPREPSAELEGPGGGGGAPVRSEIPQRAWRMSGANHQTNRHNVLLVAGEFLSSA